MALTHIILDFDGIILESASVKTEAFRTLFSFVLEHVDEIVQFYVDNGGMSRFDKFRHIYITILHVDFLEDQFEKLSCRFSDLVEGWKTGKYRPVIPVYYLRARDYSTEQVYSMTGGD